MKKNIIIFLFITVLCAATSTSHKNEPISSLSVSRKQRMPSHMVKSHSLFQRNGGQRSSQSRKKQLLLNTVSRMYRTLSSATKSNNENYSPLKLFILKTLAEPKRRQVMSYPQDSHKRNNHVNQNDYIITNNTASTMKKERLQSDFKPLLSESFSDSLGKKIKACVLNAFSNIYERVRFGEDDPLTKQILKFIDMMTSFLKTKSFNYKDIVNLVFHANEILPIARNQGINKKLFKTVLNIFLKYYQTHSNGGNNYLIHHINNIVNMIWKKSLSEDDKLSLKHSSNFTIHYWLDSIPELSQKAKNIIILLINDLVVPSYLGESIKISTDMFKNIFNFCIEIAISNLHSDIRSSSKIPLERFLLKDTTEQEFQRNFFIYSLTLLKRC